jgi:signal transduction histidine kinase
LAFLRGVSLRGRLAAVTGAGAMVVLAAGALLLYLDLSDELSDALTDELAVRVGALQIDFQDGEVTADDDLVTTQAIQPDGGVRSPRGESSILTPSELTSALEGQLIVDRAIPGLGQHARLLARPITGPDDEMLVAVAAVTTDALIDARRRLTIVLAIAGPALAALAAGLAWVLAGAALRPVRRMATEAETISLAESGRRLPQPPGDDEIAQLGRTLNAMLERIETTVAREREFVDDAAHELRTPIAVLRGEIELALEDTSDAEAVRHGLTSALEEADRLARLTDDLLTLARADAGDIGTDDATTDLLAVAGDVAARVGRHTPISIDARGQPATVRGQPDLLDQVVLNLVANASRHAASRVEIDVEQDGDHARLTVSDDGPGFPEDLLPRAFDRFVRGDSARSRSHGGAGLGLAIAASLTRALGGEIAASNRPDGGACVEVRLPVVTG